MMKKTIKILRIIFIVLGLLTTLVGGILGLTACIYWEHLTGELGYIIIIAVFWMMCAMFATSKLEEIEQKERKNDNQGN